MKIEGEKKWQWVLSQPTGTKIFTSLFFRLTCRIASYSDINSVYSDINCLSCLYNLRGHPGDRIYCCEFHFAEQVTIKKSICACLIQTPQSYASARHSGVSPEVLSTRHTEGLVQL